MSYEVALDVSRYGVGIYKVRYTDRGVIQAQTPFAGFLLCARTTSKMFSITY